MRTPAILKRCFLSACALLAAGTLRAEVTVEGIRLSSDAGLTRVVLDLSSPAEHSLFMLRQPHRLVIDIADARLGAGLAALPGGTGLVTRLRSGRRGPDQLRIVLDLATAVQPNSFVAAPKGSYGNRLVIDLTPRGGEAPVRRATPARADARRDLVIAIDPGHGGKDPGAVGRARTREKDVVLAIARRLKARIDAEPGMRAVMVRERDTLVNLYERMEIARRNRADLFVSIHADAVRDRRARGSSVYALSLKGASDEAARRLAEQQNAADLIGGVRLSDKDAVLASVLLDLSQNASIGASIEAGEKVLAELAKIGRVHKRSVQQAGFVVLKSPDVPSILVETAFISNPDEERKLTDRRHQERLAGAILAGVRNYFYENPPPDSLIAARLRAQPGEPLRHVIARGDTLSEIADRYNVSVGTLRDANNLRSDRIRIGQVLTIPTGS